MKLEQVLKGQQQQCTAAQKAELVTAVFGERRLVDAIRNTLDEHRQRLEMEQKYNRLSKDKAKRAYISGELNTIRFAIAVVEDAITAKETVQ